MKHFALLLVLLFVNAQSAYADELPGPPVYVEPGYHFLLPTSYVGRHTEVLERTKNALNARYAFVFAGSQIPGDWDREKQHSDAAHSRLFLTFTPAPLRFAVSFFNQRGAILVEFQRTAGDVLSFNEIYREILNSYRRTEGFDGLNKFMGPVVGTTAHTEDAFQREMGLEDDKRYVAAAESILSMLASPFIDVKEQALVALVREAREPVVARYLVKADLERFGFPDEQRRISAVLFDLYLNYSFEFRVMSTMLGQTLVHALNQG